MRVGANEPTDRAGDARAVLHRMLRFYRDALGNPPVHRPPSQEGLGQPLGTDRLEREAEGVADELPVQERALEVVARPGRDAPGERPVDLDEPLDVLGPPSLELERFEPAKVRVPTEELVRALSGQDPGGAARGDGEAEGDLDTAGRLAQRPDGRSPLREGALDIGDVEPDLPYGQADQARRGPGPVRGPVRDRSRRRVRRMSLWDAARGRRGSNRPLRYRGGSPAPPNRARVRPPPRSAHRARRSAPPLPPASRPPDPTPHWPRAPARQKLSSPEPPAPRGGRREPWGAIRARRSRAAGTPGRLRGPRWDAQPRPQVPRRREPPRPLQGGHRRDPPARVPWLPCRLRDQSVRGRARSLHRLGRRADPRAAQRDPPTGGAHIDRFYYCPHAPESHCECRKPGTLLFERAREDLGVQFSASAIVGDRVLDIEAGHKLGLLTVLVASRGHAAEVREEMSSHRVVADIEAPSFLAAAVRILARG